MSTERLPVEREFSAGGVVVRDDECIVIVPTRRARGGERVLALPKGHPEAGETGADAALREIREEAGVEARLVEKLGDVRYWYQRDGHADRQGRRRSSSSSYVSGEPAGDPTEVEEARWMPLDEAAEALYLSRRARDGGAR